MKRLAKFSSLVALVATLAWAGTASAQGSEAYQAINKANDLAREGAITRSIPFYEKGLKLQPLGYTLAYFNLAEVWRAKGRDSRAAFFYTLYLQHGDDETTLKQARQALSELRSDSWGQLTVTGTPTDAVTIKIDGYLLAKGKEVESLELPSGSYDISVDAVDHIGIKEEVEIESGEVSPLTYGLEEMTFFGTLKVDVDVEGAQIKVHAGPSSETRVVHEATSPMKESAKIEEGRHFVEITAPGYRRWIRNVSVSRDSESVVEATLTKALPAEIRRGE